MESYSIGLYEKAMPKDLEWKDKLMCAKDLGYDFLEISIDETDDKLKRLLWTKEEKRKLRNLADKRYSAPIRSMCLSGHRKYPLGSSDAETRRAALRIMQGALNLADDLGIRIIQLAGYDVYYENSTAETKKYFVENLRRCVDMAAKKGVMLGFETMETDFMNTVWKAMHYVELIDSPWLGVYPDAGNLTNAAVALEQSYAEDFCLGKGHIVALHLKETVPGKFREIPFCTGHVDFEAATRLAWKLGVRRFVTEMWDVGKPTWKEDIAFAVKEMKTYVNRAQEYSI